MNKNINHRLAMFGRIDTYGAEHPLTPVNDRATALLMELKAVIADMNAAVQAQETGLGERRGGADDRNRAAMTLR